MGPFKRVMCVVRDGILLCLVIPVGFLVLVGCVVEAVWDAVFGLDGYSEDDGEF